MQNVSQSEQKWQIFKIHGKTYIIMLFTNLEKALTTWNLVVEIILPEILKWWVNTVRKIILKIFIQFIFYLT